MCVYESYALLTGLAAGARGDGGRCGGSSGRQPGEQLSLLGNSNDREPGQPGLGVRRRTTRSVLGLVQMVHPFTLLSA